MTARLFPIGVPIGKRILDLALVVPGLVLISPILALIAVLLRLTQGSPVLYLQARGGYRNSIFQIYKFRTMRHAVDARGEVLPDSERLTPLGRFLRSTSLDELPELLNILRGEMSLVGPRPLLAKYLPLYSPRQAQRHFVLPGLTGWAQINGRNALSWEDKFNYDLWYVEHQSFWLDVRILAQTLLKAFRREGISQAGHATAEEFTGSAAPPGTPPSVDGG